MSGVGLECVYGTPTRFSGFVWGVRNAGHNDPDHMMLHDVFDDSFTNFVEGDSGDQVVYGGRAGPESVYNSVRSMCCDVFLLLAPDFWSVNKHA